MRITKQKRSARVIIASVLALVLVPLTAWAIVQSRTGVGGGLKKGQFSTAIVSAPAPTASIVDVSSGNVVRAASAAPTVSADRKSLTIANDEVFPSEAGQVTFTVILSTGSTSAGGYISGISSATALPTGWTAKMTSGCGASVSTSAPAAVTVQIAPSDTAASQIDLSAVGLSVVANLGTKGSGFVCADTL